MEWHGFACRLAREYDSQNTSATRVRQCAVSICSEGIDCPPGTARAPSEFCIAGYRDRGVNIEMPGVIEDCGFGGLPASDVSQQDGATLRPWRPGSREPDIDFQNLPVTGLVQLSEPLSQACSVSFHEDLLPHKPQILSLHDDGQCGSTTSVNTAIIWTISSTQGHRGFPMRLTHVSTTRPIDRPGGQLSSAGTTRQCSVEVK